MIRALLILLLLTNLSLPVMANPTFSEKHPKITKVWKKVKVFCEETTSVVSWMAAAGQVVFWVTR